jgi:hypothetical protein
MQSKQIDVRCECEDTGFIAVADSGGDDVDYVECAKHNPAFADAPSVDELIDHLGKWSGVNL